MSAVATQYKTFFDALRGTDVFPHGIPQSAVENIHIILNETIAQGVTDFRHYAYILATARGEVGTAFKPVREGFGDDAKARRDVAWLYRHDRISRNYALPHPVTGECYYGRGYAQVTHYSNYEWAAEYTGLPFLERPDLILQPDIAAKVMAFGMRHGKFTKKKLSTYFGPKHTNWVAARRIINGTDRAEEFAELAKIFHRALKLAFPDGVIPKYEDKTMKETAPEQPIPAGHPQVSTGNFGGMANNLITGALAWVGARLFGGESSPVVAPGVEPANSAFDACFAAIQSGGLTGMDFAILGGAAVLAVGKMKFPVMGRISGAISVLTGSGSK